MILEKSLIYHNIVPGTKKLSEMFGIQESLKASI